MTETAAVDAITAALRQELPVLPAGTARKLAARLWSVGQVAERMELDAWRAKRKREEAAAEGGERRQQEDAAGPNPERISDTIRQFQEAVRRARGGLGDRQPEQLTPEQRPAHLVLGVPVTATADEITSAWRRRAKVCHPDNQGGSTAMMAELNAARDAMLRTAQPTQQRS